MKLVIIRVDDNVFSDVLSKNEWNSIKKEFKDYGKIVLKINPFEKIVFKNFKTMKNFIKVYTVKKKKAKNKEFLFDSIRYWTEENTFLEMQEAFELEAFSAEDVLGDLSKDDILKMLNTEFYEVELDEFFENEEEIKNASESITNLALFITALKREFTESSEIYKYDDVKNCIENSILNGLKNRLSNEELEFLIRVVYPKN